MRFGDDRFALEFEPKADAVRLGASASAEVRTLGSLTIRAGDRVLTRAMDGGTTIVDVPLVDLAAWLATFWDDLVYGVDLPSDLGRRRDHHENKQPVLAEMWAASSAWALSPSKAESIYAWAEAHALEFAGTDYALPNVVIQRVDDFIEVSWSARAEAPPGCETVFDLSAGATLLRVDDIVPHLRALLTWVADQCAGSERDPRVREIRAVLEQKPELAGVRALERWTDRHARERFSDIVSQAELRELGLRGAASGHVVCFLRSVAGLLDAKQAAAILRTTTRSGGKPAGAALADLAAGVDPRIDPREPWESGIRLAQHVRRARGLRDGPVDVHALLDKLHVRIVQHDLESAEIDGACFLTSDGLATAVLNPSGRLARTANGARTTLAHELCHLIFDALHAHAIGQLDARSPGNNSYLEKRANAFAAELLLPRAIVLARSTAGKKIATKVLRSLASEFRVGVDLAKHQAENQGLDVTPS
ncbi:MAG: ImmA/IrrE family metallo-endopeptidase [Myxococcota bacterium]|nr:ImmA/IrrE family metallo-endopeptidase [Myxococcota bacterium]